MTALCQFVDSILTTPTLRLNLNTASWTTLAATDFGFPAMRRAVASTLLTDGEWIASSAYSNRLITLRLQINTATVDDTATELQKLVKELNRPTNLLKVQFGTTPYFFRTFRSSPDGWVIHTDGSFVSIAADVPAEPFAYGLREDALSNQTVSTDPAAASNPCYLDVTGVKGDVETPAIIRWPSSALIQGRQSLYAARRRGTPSASPFLFQAEAMTQGTDTTTQTNDANFSGAGNNYSRCTFATATMQTRLSIIDLGTASTDLRGTYRVFMRYRKNTATDDIQLQLRWGDTSSLIVIDNDVFVPADTTNIVTADLGLISIPAGSDPVYDSVSGVEMTVSDSFFLAVRAARTAGSGTVDFDFVVLVPADDRLGIVEWADDASSVTDHWVLDANDNMAHARNSSGQIISAAAPAIVGGFPMLTPNQTNRLYMLRSVGPTATWTLTTDAGVYVSYYPRYLTVRPPST